MLACVTSADDSSAARRNAHASPLVLGINCASEPSNSMFGATKRAVALPTFMLLASDVLSALSLVLSETFGDSLLDCLQLVRRRVSRLLCLQKFLKPGLLLPAGKSPTRSNLAGVVGAMVTVAPRVVEPFGEEAAVRDEAALMEVCVALKKCINSLTPMELLYLSDTEWQDNPWGYTATAADSSRSSSKRW